MIHFICCKNAWCALGDHHCEFTQRQELVTCPDCREYLELEPETEKAQAEIEKLKNERT